MTEKEDLRVKKTKKALHTAFLSLLSEKTFEEITVNELCEAAGVRRATFYKHYADKFAFLTTFTQALRDRFDRMIWQPSEFDTTAKYYVEYAKRIVGYISEHEDAIRNIIKSNLFHIVIAIICEQNYVDTKERLERSRKNGMQLCASVETLAAMCTGGVASAIYYWIIEGKKKTKEQLADEIGAIIRTTLASPPHRTPTV